MDFDKRNSNQTFYIWKCSRQQNKLMHDDDEASNYKMKYCYRSLEKEARKLPRLVQGAREHEI
jgi:hypothetical protein